MQRVRVPLAGLGRLAAPEARAGYGVAVAAVALATAVLAPVHEHVGLLNIGLLFLLLVVLVAARWGWGPALFACVVANLAFNFFFVPPLHRFTVQSPSNVVALLVFLGVAATTSALLARARAGEAAAIRREQEMAILYDLSRLIIGDVDLTSMLASVCERVRTTFTAESCAAMLPVGGRLLPAAVRGELGDAPSTTDERNAGERAMATGEIVVLGGRPGRVNPRIVGIVGRRAPVVYVPLRVGGQSRGVLRVAGRLHARIFTPDELRLLEAFADEAAPAVERDRLLHEAARAEALQEADRLKSALLSAVSHDLRTPLASIKASVSSLLQADVNWDAHSRAEFLAAIDEETDRLTRLVGNLLDLSRIEGGVLRPDADWYDVREFLETVAGRLSRTVVGHRLLLEIDPNAGDARFDYVQVGQVVTNLVENAVKFAPPGTEIRIEARRAGEMVEMRVVDRGPGIAQAERERVFDRFYRIDRAGYHAAGTGLGLAICKGLVEAQGGQIRVEATPGGGATFAFTLQAPLPEPAGRTALAVETG